MPVLHKSFLNSFYQVRVLYDTKPKNVIRKQEQIPLMKNHSNNGYYFKNNLLLPENVKYRVIICPAIPLPEIHPREMKSYAQTKTCTQRTQQHYS